MLAASALARAGRSAALVEAGLAGGDSPFLACMPSKSLLAAARRGETWEQAVARRDKVTGHLDDSPIAAQLAECGVTLVRGAGQVTRPGVVEVNGFTGGRHERGWPGQAQTAVLGYGDLVIATGAEPVAPPVEGLIDVPAWTSAEALSCPDLPRRLIVLGAGPGGCELAQIYAAFGSQVTLVEAEPRVLPDEAPFIGEILGNALRRTGADLRLGSPVVKAEALESGLALILADGTGLEADRLLLATGRRPGLGGIVARAHRRRNALVARLERDAARTDRLAIGVDLLRRAAVFLRQVFGGILPLRWHLRVQLERLEMDLRRHLARKLRQRLLQRRQPARAPRAGNVGDEVDAHGNGWGHGMAFGVLEGLGAGRTSANVRQARK